VSQGFTAVAALSAGGLSTVWGASVAAFNQVDLSGWPLGSCDLAEHYAAVAARIGVSGTNDDAMAASLGDGLPLDPPLQPTGAVAVLQSAYLRQAPAGLRLGLARNAVITRDRAGRQRCTYDKSCAFGCAAGAIYDSGRELAELRQRPNLHVVDGTIVESLFPRGASWQVNGRHRRNGATGPVTARSVVLAAGVLASTRLALLALDRYDQDVPLLNTPSMTLAFLLPRRIGATSTEHGYGMAQLAYEASAGGVATFGLLYEAEGFAAADLASSSPLTRPATAAMLGMLSPALILGMLYFPGHYSRNFVRLRCSGELFVSGDVSPALAGARRTAIRHIRRSFRKLGAWLLPGVSRPLPPGAEVHYAGTLPMGSATTLSGELIGQRGLFVADGSVLPTLPPKSHTLTVMANARRIGANLAQQLR
jgi:choline dehydrogenase-like flavoprotein